jgi:hypothetical protein
VAQVSGLDDTTSPAFDAAGRTVAVVDGAEARIWEAATGRSILRLHTQGLRLYSPRLTGNDLALVDDQSRTWRINADLPAVILQTCARPVTVDWNRYFPGTDPQRLCPP